MFSLMVDTSHWVYPLDWKRLYYLLKTMLPDTEPVVSIKVSEGVTQHNDGVLAGAMAFDAGFKNVSPFHFFSTADNPINQAKIFLKQWDKLMWTVRPALDLEHVGYNPEPGSNYANTVRSWYSVVDKAVNAYCIHYSNLDYINRFFGDEDFALHPLWLSQPPSNYKMLLPAPTCPLPWLFVSWWQRSFVNFMGKWYGVEANNHLDLDIAYWIPRPNQGYTPPDVPPPPPPNGERKSQVIVDALSIRTGAGTTFPKTGEYLYRNNIIDVLESSSSPSAPTEWVRHSKGWSCHHSNTLTYMKDL